MNVETTIEFRDFLLVFIGKTGPHSLLREKTKLLIQKLENEIKYISPNTSLYADLILDDPIELKINFRSP